MTTATVSEINDFASRVERLCEFLLIGMKKHGSNDVVIIQKLQEDAANLQFTTSNPSLGIDGLADFMKGVPAP